MTDYSYAIQVLRWGIRDAERCAEASERKARGMPSGGHGYLSRAREHREHAEQCRRLIEMAEAALASDPARRVL